MYENFDKIIYGVNILFYKNMIRSKKLNNLMLLRNVNITKDFCQEIFDYMFYNNKTSIGLNVMKYIYSDSYRMRKCRFNELIYIIREKSIIAINNAFYSMQTTDNKEGVYDGDDGNILGTFAINAYCKIYLGYDIFLCIKFNDIDNHMFILKNNLKELTYIFEQYYG